MDENKTLTPTQTAAPEKETAAVNTPAAETTTPAKETPKPAAAAKTAPVPVKKQEVAAKQSKMAVFKAEFKKIIWPNKQDLRKKTGSVIVTSLIMGVIIFAMDTVFTTLYNLVLGLLG